MQNQQQLVHSRAILRDLGLLTAARDGNYVGSNRRADVIYGHVATRKPLTHLLLLLLNTAKTRKQVALREQAFFQRLFA
jgi:hypothetical protein